MEKAHSINGVQGRLWYVKNPGVRAAGCHDAQKWISESRPVKGYGANAVLSVEIRFDDQCKNGHNTFAITGDIRAGRREIAGGCLHDDIAAVFPELAGLIKWHLCSTHGPMHYTANTLYFASDRDSSGRVAGEPCAWEHVVYFGNSPVSHKISGKFSKFLQERMQRDQDGDWYLDPAHGEFRVVDIAHEKRPGETYEFKPKYTFPGFGLKWHDCPFDDEVTAQQWALALNGIRCEFDSIATDHSKGKARELDKARSAAVWPEATDEQLCAPRDELKAALEARLPGMLAAMRDDLQAAGLLWNAINTWPKGPTIPQR
jgi:hypothetical protein